MAAQPARPGDERSDQDARIGWYIVLGTIPIAIFGFVFSDQIENGARDLYLIGTTLIVLGLLLLVAEKVGRRERSMDDVDARDGLVVGFAQATGARAGRLALRARRSPPACSSGFDRAAAARFSFLLSVPAVVLSGLFEMRKFVGERRTTTPGRRRWSWPRLLAFVVGLRVDRVPAALPGVAHDLRVRGATAWCWARWCSCSPRTGAIA